MSLIASDWRSTWRADETVTPLEGARGAGERAGSIGLADFPAGTYPACSNHGAMTCVKREPEDGVHGSYWRCLAEGCNVGAEWSGPKLEGCPETRWDGPYSFRCGMGAESGVCSIHGRFR